jgi:hypothetical protein
LKARQLPTSIESQLRTAFSAACEETDEVLRAFALEVTSDGGLFSRPARNSRFPARRPAAAESVASGTAHRSPYAKIKFGDKKYLVTDRPAGNVFLPNKLPEAATRRKIAKVDSPGSFILSRGLSVNQDVKKGLSVQRPARQSRDLPENRDVLTAMTRGYASGRSRLVDSLGEAAEQAQKKKRKSKDDSSPRPGRRGPSG